MSSDDRRLSRKDRGFRLKPGLRTPRTIRGWFATPARRARIGLALLLVTALANVYMVRDVLELLGNRRPTEWNAGDFVTRLAPVKSRVPADCEILYVDDSPEQGIRNLMLARYALAPLRVVTRGNSPWMLVAGAKTAAADKAERPLQQIIELDGGMALYRRMD